MQSLASDDHAAEHARHFAAVIAGPFDTFVQRRDALAKQLRASKDAAGAAAVKALRKPSRIAWALDMGAVQRADALDRLMNAVAGTIDAQSTGGDVRAAIAALRAAVRDFAAEAADSAAAAGTALDANALASALLAVLGRPESFRQLCAGHLQEIPDAGSLDFLDALPALLPAERPRPRLVKGSPAKPAEPSSRDKAAEEAARRAAEALAEARREAMAAQAALGEAASALGNAEAKLRQAEQDVNAARTSHERAVERARAAEERVRSAETAAAKTGGRT